MKQLLVFAGDVGDKFFVPSTLPCFDKVAVKDRNLDSDFTELEGSQVCKHLNSSCLQDHCSMNSSLCSTHPKVSFMLLSYIMMIHAELTFSDVQNSV